MGEPLKATITVNQADEYEEGPPEKVTKECAAGAAEKAMSAVALAIGASQEVRDRIGKKLIAKATHPRRIAQEEKNVRKFNRKANRGARKNRGKWKYQRTQAKIRLRKLVNEGNVPDPKLLNAEVRKELEEALEKASALKKALHGAVGGAIADALVETAVQLGKAVLDGKPPDPKKLAEAVLKAAGEGFISGAIAATIVAGIGGVAATVGGELLIGVLVGVFVSTLIERLEEYFKEAHGVEA